MLINVSRYLLIQLAEEACKIEIDILRDPVRKQDQYMAVFGGMRVLQIDNNGNVTATPVVLPASSMYRFNRKYTCLLYRH